jgi:hypothetical protein
VLKKVPLANAGGISFSLIPLSIDISLLLFSEQKKRRENLKVWFYDMPANCQNTKMHPTGKRLRLSLFFALKK